MTRGQRLVLASLAALAVVLAAVLVVVERSRDDAPVRLATDVPPTTTSSSTTLAPPSDGDVVELTPVPTSAPPAADAPPPADAPTPTTVAEQPTPTTAPAREIDAAGAILRRPAGEDVRRAETGGGCQSLADPGWQAECGTAAAQGGNLVWIVQRRETASRVLVLREKTGGRWQVVLAADGGAYPRIGVTVEDVSGDGAADVVVGFRTGGPGDLFVDVVEGPGLVTANVSLASGSVVAEPGRLDAWSERSPGQYDRLVIRKEQGRWLARHEGTTATPDVPRSEVAG